MTVTMRVLLDQLVAPTDSDLAAASAGLVRGLLESVPAGCEVEALVPAMTPRDAEVLAARLPGIAHVRRMPLRRRALAAAWQIGAVPGVGSGMMQSPTLLAPLGRHDRVHDNDQRVVTVWDLRAWDAPRELPRGAVAWQRGMLARAVRYADAVVVPTHSIAERLAEIARLGSRIRVIAGAPEEGLSAPSDPVGRGRDLGLPPRYVVLTGGLAPSDGLAAGLAAAAEALHGQPDIEVVVIDAPEGEEPAIADLASAAGIPERRVHVRGRQDAADRAAVIAAAAVFAAPASRAAFPWRVIDALTLGVPVVAAGSAVHREVIVDGGLVVSDEPGAFGAALAEAMGPPSERLRVLALDRARAFSWREAAERVWQLHAEL